MTIASLEIGDLVAEMAEKYVGVRSAHHSSFHTGSYYAENNSLPRDEKVEGFLRRYAGLRWRDDYYAYLRQEHIPPSAETGMCCSGLVNLAVTNALKLLGIVADVPMHVHEFYSWPLTTFVSITNPNLNLDRGTLLFAHTSVYRPFLNHIGIYVGRDQIVHSPGIDPEEGKECPKVEKVSLKEFTRGSTYAAAKRLIL